MKIFISSSWINKHAVLLLAAELERLKFEVGSFVFDNDVEYSVIGQTKDRWNQSVDYGEWCLKDEAEKIMKKDLAAIKECDAVIIIEPAGRDAWCHVGLAVSQGKKIFGLNSKGRKVGLMRKLVLWFEEPETMIKHLLKESGKIGRYSEYYHRRLVEILQEASNDDFTFLVQSSGVPQTEIREDNVVVILDGVNG